MKRDWSEEERKAAALIVHRKAYPRCLEGLREILITQWLKHPISNAEANAATDLQCENTFLAEQVKEARELLHYFNGIVDAMWIEPSMSHRRIALLRRNPEESL